MYISVLMHFWNGCCYCCQGGRLVVNMVVGWSYTWWEVGHKHGGGLVLNMGGWSYTWWEVGPTHGGRLVLHMVGGWS